MRLYPQECSYLCCRSLENMSRVLLRWHMGQAVGLGCPGCYSSLRYILFSTEHWRWAIAIDSSPRSSGLQREEAKGSLVKTPGNWLSASSAVRKPVAARWVKWRSVGNGNVLCLDSINVSILVLIKYYSFARCFFLEEPVESIHRIWLFTVACVSVSFFE